MMTAIVFKISNTSLPTETRSLFYSCKYNHSNKVFQNVMNCFKITSLRAWRMSYIEKPSEKLYMINVIDLHILTQITCILQMIYFPVSYDL